MERLLKIISFWIILITLPIIILFTSVEIATFDEDFYRIKYDQYEVVKNTAIQKDELMNITGEMLDYLKGDRQDLAIYGEVNGNNRLVFDERDQKHMVDVQVLFLKGFRIRNMAVILFVAAFLTLNMRKRDRRKAAKGIFLSGIISIGIIILLAVIISTDFSKYFDMFHYLFFDNDLWRLDPNKSILINLVPLGFFMDIAIKISIYFFGSLGLCTLFSGVYLKRAGKGKWDRV